jgi:phosphoesterase RecJ-like protein
MMQQMPFTEYLAAAKSFIETHDNFLVISHINPDGDAASSTCAIGWLLQTLGKQYTMVNADVMPDRFDYIQGIKQIRRAAELDESTSFQHVICVDCADYARVGDAQSLVHENAVMLNIDHHVSNKRFGHVHLIDVEAAATAQVIFSLLSFMQIPLDRAVAECLYTGILTDTGGFRYQNTTPKVLEVASKLLEQGVQPTEIAKVSLEQLTMSHISMLQRALTTLKFNESGKLAYVVASMQDLQETGATADDLDGIVRYPVNIKGIEIGILFKQLEERKFKISFRSNDYVNVSEIAGSFGGGGHLRAAGCNVDGSLEDVIRLVVSAAEQRL